eukprot:3149557-Prymnesium_polylepis.1
MIATASEGGADVFRLNYFDRYAYLAQVAEMRPGCALAAPWLRPGCSHAGSPQAELRTPLRCCSRLSSTSRWR